MAPTSDLHPPLRCPVCLAGFWSPRAVCRGKRRTFTGYGPEHDSVKVVAARLVAGRLAEFGAAPPRRPGRQGQVRRLGPGSAGRPAPPPQR